MTAQQYDSQEFRWNFLGLCNVRKLDRAFTIMIRKMLHGANGIAGFLGQHILLLPVATLIFNPLSRQSAN